MAGHVAWTQRRVPGNVAFPSLPWLFPQSPQVRRPTHTIPCGLGTGALKFQITKDRTAQRAMSGFNQFQPARNHIPNQLPALAPRQSNHKEDLTLTLESSGTIEEEPMGLGCQCLAKILPSLQPHCGSHNSLWPECSTTIDDPQFRHHRSALPALSDSTNTGGPVPAPTHLTMPVLPL